ncbi:MarR family transcriptional regulator [Hellea sp.]|nr:MarR family transcriptional regulator [Hellea sp.]
MSSAIKPNLIKDIRPKLKVDPVEYADTTFQALSERISEDYSHVVKTCVMPHMGETHGLKARELRVMACIASYDYALTPAHIAAMIRYDPATVTRAAKRLAEANMVRREDNEKDTRSIVLSLTESGEALVARYNARIKIVFSSLEQMMSKSFSTEEKTDYLTAIYKVSKRAEIMREFAANLPKV